MKLRNSKITFHIFVYIIHLLSIQIFARSKNVTNGRTSYDLKLEVMKNEFQVYFKEK